MSKKLVIAAVTVEKRRALATVLYSDDRPLEVHVDPQQGSSLLSGIYVGKVERVQPGLSAAFVRIRPDTAAYLPFAPDERYLYTVSGRSGALRVGDELLVQVEKEAMKSKLPRLSSDISLAGRWMVLSTEPFGLHFSRKLQENDRIVWNRSGIPSGIG